MTSYRIAYNNESMPYFDLKHGHADTDTLEGAILDIFIEKQNVTPVYMYGNYEWGSIDPDTGRVNLNWLNSKIPKRN